VHVDPSIALNNVKDQVIAVFGASKGIGAAVAYMGRGHGAKVYGFSRSEGVDITDAAAVEKALADIKAKEGHINHVVNTAAVLRFGKLTDRSIEDIKQEIDINYFGSLNVVRASIPYLAETAGSIALFTSSSFTRGRSLYTPYSSTKAALVNLVQGIAEETATSGVRINAINPERTATPMRTEHFGEEPPGTLLKAESVAAATLRTLLSPYSGMVVDVRLTDPENRS